MLTITEIHQANLAGARAKAHADNRAQYLRDASLAELAALTGQLAAECLYRGVQVAGPLGLVAARLEMVAAKEGGR